MYFVLDDKNAQSKLASFSSSNKSLLVVDYSGRLLMPGFVDAHCHAPQYTFAGIVHA